MIYVNHGNTNMTKLKLQSALKTNQTKRYTAFLDLPINQIFLLFITYNFFFFTYIKMSKNSCAKYWQKNKERM